jgi:hypothetical protein
MTGHGFLRVAALALGACATLAAAGCGQGHATAAAHGAAGFTPSPAQHTPGPAVSPGQGAGVQASPSPPPGSQPAQAATYLTRVQVDAQRIIAASAARSTSCATRDVSGCRTAFQKVASAEATFRRDLDGHPAPDCLKPVDATIRSALGLYQQGAQVGIQGLAAGSTSQVAQGGGLLDQGTTRLTAVTDQLRLVACRGNAPGVAP